MLALSILLAQIDNRDHEALRPGAGKIFGTEITLVIGIVLVFAAALFFWAFFLRKRPKEIRGARVLERGHRISSKASNDNVSGKRRRRKRRADHPDNWGRNPTLGETGGLPPVRPEEPEAPSSESQAPPAR